MNIKHHKSSLVWIKMRSYYSFTTVILMFYICILSYFIVES